MISRPDRSDAYLIVKGVLFLGLGFAYAVVSVPHTTRSSLSTVTDYVPLHVFGYLWLAVGVYCVLAGFLDWKVFGFAIGIIMPTVWGFMYLVCWFNGDPGRGWVTCGIFWAIAGAMFCVAGLVDPRPIVKRARGDV